MIKKTLSAMLVSFMIFTSCGIFERVTTEIPLEFDIPIEFDIDKALKVSGLDQLPDPLPAGIKRDDIYVPLPTNLSVSISERDEIKQYANKIYNVRIESLSFIIEENGFTQEIRPSILAISKKTSRELATTALESETILISSLPKINPDIGNGTSLICNDELETTETEYDYTFDEKGDYRCKPDFDAESSVECNIIPGGKDAPSEHLKKLEFTPKIMFCDPRQNVLKEGILLYIDSDKYSNKPSGNVKFKMRLKIVLRVAPLD